MLLAICTTQVKKREKRDFKKRKKYGYEVFASRGFEPGPSDSVRTKFHASVHWTTWGDSDSATLKEVYIPSLWSLTVFKDDFFVFFFFLISV